MSTLNINMTSDSKIKCKKCRSVVLEKCGGIVVTGHNIKFSFQVDDNEEENCGMNDSVWYLDDDSAPTWILERVKDGEWTKGRLNCPKCSARIGSFDFTSGSRCNCSKNVLPGIRLIKTKVDV